MLMRDDSTHIQAAQITVDNLSYQVNGTRLIDIPNLKLAGAGITVIMGPNGAGKSLLLRSFSLKSPTATSSAKKRRSTRSLLAFVT